MACLLHAEDTTLSLHKSFKLKRISIPATPKVGRGYHHSNTSSKGEAFGGEK